MALRLHVPSEPCSGHGTPISTVGAWSLQVVTNACAGIECRSMGSNAGLSHSHSHAYLRSYLKSATASRNHDATVPPSLSDCRNEGILQMREKSFAATVTLHTGTNPFHSDISCNLQDGLWATCDSHHDECLRSEVPTCPKLTGFLKTDMGST